MLEVPDGLMNSLMGLFAGSGDAISPWKSQGAGALALLGNDDNLQTEAAIIRAGSRL
jgi:hypothetical protein